MLVKYFFKIILYYSILQFVLFKTTLFFTTSDIVLHNSDAYSISLTSNLQIAHFVGNGHSV